MKKKHQFGLYGVHLSAIICENTALVHWIRCEPLGKHLGNVLFFAESHEKMNTICIFSPDQVTHDISATVWADTDIRLIIKITMRKKYICIIFYFHSPWGGDCRLEEGGSSLTLTIIPPAGGSGIGSFTISMVLVAVNKNRLFIVMSGGMDYQKIFLKWKVLRLNLREANLSLSASKPVCVVSVWVSPRPLE